MPKRENSVRPAKLPSVGIFLEDKENRVWDAKLPRLRTFFASCKRLVRN